MDCKNLLAIAAAIFAFFSDAPGFGQVIGSGTVIVGLAPVDLRTEKANTSSRPEPDSSDLLAKTASELLPNYIQRGLERGLDRRVSTIPLPPTSGTVASTPAANFQLYPTVVNMGFLGTRITVRASSKSDSPTAASEQPLGEEVLLLSPSANFGDLDDRLSDFGLRLAKRLTEPSATNVASPDSRLPRGIVGFYCVSPSDPEDSQLGRLARSLTIELPYQLSQAARKRSLEFTVRGLDIKEAITTCDSSTSVGTITPRNTYSLPNDSRIENFSWTGTVSRDPKNKGKFALVLRTRDTSGGGNFRPLPAVTIEQSSEPNLPTIADKLIASFVQIYAASQYRVYLHFESEAIRSNLEQKIASALSTNGYTVVGSDPPNATIAASWIDYFFPEDCSTAINIRQILLPSLPPTSIPFVRKQPANRPGTIGIWLSTKQTPSPPKAECPP
jgi:hypothetical protein